MITLARVASRLGRRAIRPRPSRSPPRSLARSNRPRMPPNRWEREARSSRSRRPCLPPPLRG